MFKDEYKAKLCHFRNANYDLLINNHKYDNKVVMLSNKNKKYDCEKLKNQDNDEIQVLLKNLLENSFNKNNDTSKCFFVFISESNNYDNVLKTVKDTDFTIKFLHFVLNNRLNQYKHSVFANNCVNDVILFLFIVD